MVWSGARRSPGAMDLGKIITFDAWRHDGQASMVEDGQVARAQGICRRRQHHDRLAAADGRRLYAEGAGDRPRRSGRGRRLTHIWIDAGGALQAGLRARRFARAGVLWPGRARCPPSPRQCAAGLHQPGAFGRRYALDAEARRAFAEDRRSRHADRAGGLWCHLIVASNMIRAIKAVSTERPRSAEFSLFAFGGSGPCSPPAWRLSSASTSGRATIWRACSRPSACFMPTSEHRYARTFRRLLRRSDAGEIDAWRWLAMALGERAARG